MLKMRMDRFKTCPYSNNKQTRGKTIDFPYGLIGMISFMYRSIVMIEKEPPYDSLQPVGAGFKPAQDPDRGGGNNRPSNIHVNISGSLIFQTV